MELVAPTLDAAAGNFARFGRTSPVFSGALLLAESAKERIFDRIATAGASGSWRLQPVAGEPQTIIADSGMHRILVVCGRQVRCALGLEVIALGTTSDYPEDRELDETLDRVVGDGAVAAVPWGFGKWLGRPGVRVSRLFSRGAQKSIFAGDNGGRLQILKQPALLDVARAAGFGILPGTDPFPFGSDYRRVGAFGFLAGIEPDPSAPWTTLREWLQSCAQSPTAYGRALNPIRFAFNQCGIQVHNRMWNRRGV